MSYASELATQSRIPQTILVINLDYCDNTHGSAPCTATETGDDKCYNTRSTCNDPANYTNTTGRDLKICLKGKPLPLPGETVYPILKGTPKTQAAMLDPSRSLTTNEKGTLELYDIPHNDVGIDPYVSDRSTYPNAPGTLIGKMLARNIYYRGRTITMKEGFQGLPENEYVSKKYIIDKWTPPYKGISKITYKDVLKRADRAKAPMPVDWKVADNPLTAGATTINYSGSDIGPTSGVIRIEDELIRFTGRSSTQFTGCTRGVDIGSIQTTGAEHSQDEKIALCYVMEDTNVWGIIYDLLTNDTSQCSNAIAVDADIDITGAESERDTWLQSFDFTGVITKPMAISKIFQELQEQSLSNLYWEEEEQKIKFKVFAPTSPGESTTSLNDSANIIDIKPDNNEDARLSRILLHFDKIKIEDDDKWDSYSSHAMSPDFTSEDEDHYGEPEMKTIYSRWIQSSIIANTICNRLIGRFVDPPKKCDVTVEMKDNDPKKADLISLTSDAIPTVGGADDTKIMQILKKMKKGEGKFEFKMMDTAMSRRYGFIAPAGYPDYGSATDEQKKRWFIGDSNNKVNGGAEDGYYIW